MSKYLLDKESIGKLALEVFGEERVWVKEESEKMEVYNEEWDEDSYLENPDSYDVPEYIMKTTPVINVYVHFPKVDISNSAGHQHTLYDLFARFKICHIMPDAEYKCDVYFEGRRTSFTFNEMYSQYAHSHLPWTLDFHNFCTGSSYYNTLLTEIRLNPTEENWLMIFMGLENFVSWESREGGPYRYIADIRGPSDNVRDSSLETELKKIIPYLPKSVWTYTDSLKLIENHPILYQIFDKYSTIRKLSSIDDGRAKEYIDSWTYDYKNKLFRWKEGLPEEKEFPFKVLYEPTNDNPQIAREVVDRYIQIINKQVKEYNQNLSYERAKEKYYPVTVAKTGIIQ